MRPDEAPAGPPRPMRDPSGPRSRLVHGPRFLVEDTQRSKVEPVAGSKRDAGIEAQPEFACDQRIGQGSRSWPRRARCTGHRSGSPMRTIRDHGRFLHVHAVVGFEPNPVLIDDTDDCDRHLEPPRGDSRYSVEDAVGRGVEDVIAPNRGNALVLVDRDDAGNQVFNAKPPRATPAARRRNFQPAMPQAAGPIASQNWRNGGHRSANWA